MRADTTDVAFRLLISLGELWEGLCRAGIDPTQRGLHMCKEYLGGYTRYSAGPGSHARLVVEWNESSRHLRVLRCDDWPGFEATVSATVAAVRSAARLRGLLEVVDAAFVKACEEPCLPARRTTVPMHALASSSFAARR
ncbi:MAG: hypothetical protein HS107_09800 [Thermoflexaceae bacterium]|nr:hypothetical protein [Thermoflexaceae bacterium]